MNYYAHRKYLVVFEEPRDVDQANILYDNVTFTLETIEGTQYGNIHEDVIAKNMDGDRFIVSRREVRERHVPVKRRKVNIGMSYEEMGRMYAQGWVANEDDKYINRTAEIASEKYDNSL